jgi:arylsulfatase A-like enzyme
VSKRDLIWISIAVAFAAALAALLGRPSAPEPLERVVLITIDTLRADHLNTFGYPRETAPFLTDLARKSLVFSNAFSASSYTSPSHASIFTGLYPPQHGVLINGAQLEASIPTMAQLFRDSGYETAAFSGIRFLKQLNPGFDIFTARERKHDRYRTAPEIVDLISAWLDPHSPQDRFFLWVHFFDVHAYQPHEREAADDDYLRRVVASSSLQGPAFREFLLQRQGIPTVDPGRRGEVMALVNGYDAQILKVDLQIARLFQEFESRGMRDHTLWVITADHGEGLYSHGVRGHGERISREQVRVPLLLHFSDQRYGPAEIDDLVRHVDLFPTVADLIGASISPLFLPLEGESLLPLIVHTGSPDPARFSYAQRHLPDALRQGRARNASDLYSLQDVRYKYILHPQGQDEFYDLREDPLELENLIGNDSESESLLRSRLRALYAKMLRQTQGIEPGGVSDRDLEELRALGYVQ